LVQPLFIIELPFALLLGGLVMRRSMAPVLVAVGVVTAGCGEPRERGALGRDADRSGGLWCWR